MPTKKEAIALLSELIERNLHPIGFKAFKGRWEREVAEGFVQKVWMAKGTFGLQFQVKFGVLFEELKAERGKLEADIFFEMYYQARDNQIELNRALTFDFPMEDDLRIRIIEDAIRLRLCPDLEKFRSRAAIKEKAEKDSLFRMLMLPKVLRILGL